MAKETPLKKSDSEISLQLAYLASGGHLKDLQGLDQNVLKAMYKAAYARYGAGRYEEALVLFKYLSLMEHTNRSYLLGLGATLKELKRFYQAVRVLECIKVTDDNDPRLLLCKAECFIHLKDDGKAKELLQQAEQHISGSTQWRKEYQQIQRLQQRVFRNARRL